MTGRPLPAKSIRVKSKNAAQSSRNWYVPPLSLPLITKLSLYLSAPANGIRCLSTVGMGLSEPSKQSAPLYPADTVIVGAMEPKNAT